MLVIISDLHFTDGTTSNRDEEDGRDLFNVSPRAFELLLARISGIIKRREQHEAKIKTVTFVYNGDIFDPLRTYDWFDVPKTDRPWSVPLKKNRVYKKCHQILKNIVEHNREALEWLSGDHDHFDKVWTVNIEPERVYVPGNHDRIMNLYGPCRALVRQSLLGKSNPSGRLRFNNVHRDPKHKTIAMHGHESEPFNCEFDTSGEPKHDAVPIGDPLTTMLCARLGYKLQTASIPPLAKRRFKDIDNVRPTLATVRYVQDIIQDFEIGAQVKREIKAVVSDFRRLPFYKAWIKKHNRRNIGFDEADKLDTLLRAMDLIGTSVPAGLLEKLAGFFKDESAETWAQKNLGERDRHADMRYCVLGHTHDPLHVPICLELHQKQKVEKHYLNSGTFRATFKQTFDKQDFLRCQRMSFVIVYAAREFDPSENKPVYEMWSGLRMQH